MSEDKAPLLKIYLQEYDKKINALGRYIRYTLVEP
jgi:hypothetical protein